MIVWCEMNKEFTEVIWREDGEPICFFPEPYQKSKGGNVCNEPEKNFVELSDCELKAILP